MEIYTDGSYSARTKLAGSGVVFPTRPDLDISERPPGLATNQRAELWAIRRALETAPPGPITIFTDSVYAMKCLSEWLPAWERNGWKNSKGDPVMNQDIIRPAVAILRGRHEPVTLRHVRAHRGHEWNERADALARRASGI